MNEHTFLVEMKKLVSLMESKNLTVKGCAIEQIQYLEKKYGVLPKYYKIFLSLLGEMSGD
ncbi:SMI1/KNR4 family protein, partial [Salmonella enterica subsp. enterica]|nr:SMI1/KNR4 family protein [Salmonella enterica subsp. enterica]